MNANKVNQISTLVEDLVKDYEKSETHAILFYSGDITRDFRLLEGKVSRYRERLNKVLIENGSLIIREDRDSVREEDIPAKLL